MSEEKDWRIKNLEKIHDELTEFARLCYSAVSIVYSKNIGELIFYFDMVSKIATKWYNKGYITQKQCNDIISYTKVIANKISGEKTDIETFTITMFYVLEKIAEAFGCIVQTKVLLQEGGVPA